MGNPFPGPQPYRSQDSALFFGRRVLVEDLGDAVLSRRVLTVYGPSGAGKSSLLQAGVVPFLDDEWDLRCVVVDSWPEDRVGGAGPEARIAEVLAEELSLGEQPDLESALARAFRRSDRPILIVLDQLEQLLENHEREVLDAFVQVLDDLEHRRELSLHVVLSLREDYLGRWNGLLDDLPRLTRHGFRVPRLTVPEITRAAVKTAASAEDPQLWDGNVLEPLVEGMALPGQWKADAREVESAFVQIVCRVLYDRGDALAGLVEAREREMEAAARRLRLRLRDKDDDDHDDESAEQRASRRLATGILEGYLNKVLGRLGPDEMPTRHLLEHDMITLSGARKVVVLDALEEAWTESRPLKPVLESLTRARILRSNVHGDQVTYELGHDWLAVPLRDTALQKREVAAARRARLRRLGAVLLIVAALAFAGWANERAAEAVALQERAERLQQEAEVAAGDATRAKDLAVHAAEAAEVAQAQAEEQREEAIHAREQALEAEDRAMKAARAAAEAEADAYAARAAALGAQETAEESAGKAWDVLRMLAVQKLQDDPTRAGPFMAQVKKGMRFPQWSAQAFALLQSARSRTPVQTGVREPLELAVLPAGRQVLASTSSGELRGLVPEADGGTWHELEAGIRDLAVSDDGTLAALAGDDGSVVLLDLTGTDPPQTFTHFPSRVWSLAFAPGGHRLAAGAERGGTALWTPGDSWQWRPEHSAAVLDVVWSRGGQRVVSASADGALQSWEPDGLSGTEALVMGGGLYDLAVGGGAIWIAGAQGELGRVAADFAGIESHHLTGSRLVSLAWAGGVLAAADLEGVVSLVRPTRSGKLEVLVQTPTGGRLGDLVPSPDGKAIAAGGADGVVWLWRLSGKRVLEVQRLRGHPAPVRALAFDTAGASTVLHSVDDAGSWRTWPVQGRSLGRVLRDGKGAVLDGRRVTGLGWSEDGEALFVSLEGGESLAYALDGVLQGPGPTTSGGEGLPMRSERLSLANETVHSGVAIEVVDRNYAVPPPDSGGTRQAPYLLPGHVDQVHTVSVHPGYSHLVSASEDRTVRLWPLHTPGDLLGAVQSLGGCIEARDRRRHLLEDGDTAKDLGCGGGNL